MPKPKRTIRPVEKSISIPEDIAAKVDLMLFSDFEGRIPHGAWSRLVVGLLRDHLETVKHLIPPEGGQP